MACYGQVQERRENTQRLNYGVARCHTVEFKYSDFVIVSLLSGLERTKRDLFNTQEECGKAAF